MRRVAGMVVALCAMALVGAATGPDRSQSASATTRTTAVGVGLREYRIAVYRNRVAPGKVRFNIENLGEDDHDLRVSGPSGASAVRGTSPEIDPGARSTLTVTLRRPGLYRLVCTIGDHTALGMVARFRVVRR